MKRLLSRTLCISLCLFVAGLHPVLGQTASVRGTVSTADGSKPLAGASVTLMQALADEEVAADATDREGRFEIRGLAAGAYELVVRFVGFRPFRTSLTLVQGEQRTVGVSMALAPINIDEVVVTASRRVEKALEVPAAISILDAEALTRDVGSSPAAALRSVTGVDMQQVGLNRYQVAVRGSMRSFVTSIYTLVDYREMNTAAVGVAQFTAMPIHALDLARIEVVRGPGSALYGSGVDQGVIHFISKDPFTYPGTSLSVGGGQQHQVQGAFRHAGVVRGRLGYKIVGSYFRGEDWKLDPDDPHDAEILEDIAPRLTGVDGRDAGPLGERDYETYSWYLNGQAQYRFTDKTTLTANLSLGKSKVIAVGGQTVGALEMNVPTLLAQLRLQAGRFFAQAYMYPNLVDEDVFFYGSGQLLYDKGMQVDLQAQYALDLMQGRENLVFGVDYKLTTPRTLGTITGRFEENDQYALLGGYVHSLTRLTDQFDLTASARLDYIDATRDVQLSPRAALVFKPTPSHNLRLTYNRAFGRPNVFDYFWDFFVGDRGAFAIRVMGSSSHFTFSDPRQTSSFIGIPGFSGHDPGVGIALARAYAASSGMLTAPGGPLADASPELRALLFDRTSQIEGFSEGVMAFISPEGEPRMVSDLNDQGRLKQPITDTVEVGYKGLIGGRLLVDLGVYYTKKKHFLGDRILTPFVLTPGVSRDLTEAVAAAFTDAELAPFGLDVATLAQLYGQAAGATLGGSPVGLIEPQENFDPSTKPELLQVKHNFGEIDFFGAEISVDAFLGDRWTGYFNYAWVSDTFFDKEELGADATEQDFVSMDAPQEKARGGVAYTAPGGIHWSASIRYVKSFRVQRTITPGRVDAYTLVDLGFGYDAARYVPGLRIDVTAQNVLNHRHREYIRFPMIGRLVTARLTYSL
ncbi:MAG: TonB-dependent receptor [Rhodothermales bacterium]